MLTQGNPAVKALSGDGQKPWEGNDGQKPWERQDGDKAPCHFWGTEEGCREKRTYAHSWGSLEKSSRRLLFSSTKHRKKGCPTVKPKEGNGGAQKGNRKVAKIQDKKGQKGLEKAGQKETPSPAKEAAEDLVQNLSGLVKSMTSIKSLFIKTVKADGDDSGEYALLDGGAKHALRQAKSSEIPHLWPVQVEMAMGSVTLYKCPAHNTLLALDSVEPIIPLRLLVDHGFKINWQKDRCDISHPKHGTLERVRRQGCPVMDRQSALDLLESLENGGIGGHYEPSDHEIDWWKKRNPQVPERIWALMRGQGLNWEEVASTLPWNKAKRRRLERARGGVVVHLFSIAAGPPSRTVSRFRHRSPGPRPLRGRRDLRFGLKDLNERESMRVDGDSALWLKTLGLYERSQEGMAENGPLGSMWPCGGASPRSSRVCG